MLPRLKQGSWEHRVQASLPVSLKDGIAQPPYCASVWRLTHWLNARTERCIPIKLRFLRTRLLSSNLINLWFFFFNHFNFCCVMPFVLIAMIHYTCTGMFCYVKIMAFTWSWPPFCISVSLWTVLGYSWEEGRGGNVIQLDKWPVTLLAWTCQNMHT